METYCICQWHIHMGGTLKTLVCSFCAINCTEQINKGMHALFEWNVLVSLIRVSNPAWVCIRKLILWLHFKAYKPPTDCCMHAMHLLPDICLLSSIAALHSHSGLGGLVWALSGGQRDYTLRWVQWGITFSRYRPSHGQLFNPRLIQGTGSQHKWKLSLS